MQSNVLYSSGVALKVVGVKFRTLDHWATSGLAIPSVVANGYGSERQYSRDDLVWLMAVDVLRQIGVPAQIIRTLRADVYGPERPDTLEYAVPSALGRVAVDLARIRNMVDRALEKTRGAA
jgi:DNA-binding transcriptional MerR regulator